MKLEYVIFQTDNRIGPGKKYQDFYPFEIEHLLQKWEALTQRMSLVAPSLIKG